jgi:hypothetical protein
VAPTADFTQFTFIQPDNAGNGQVWLLPLCWSSITLTNTVIGTAPAGTTVNDAMICGTFDRIDFLKFDGTAPTSAQEVRTIDPSCGILPSVAGAQPLAITASCEPTSLCTINTDPRAS